MIFSVLVLFLILTAAFSKPMLFRTFSYQTYRTLSDTADAINTCVPNSITYYFDLYSISTQNNVNFEIINPDGSVAYSSTYSGSAFSSDHFASSSSVTSEFSAMNRIDSYRYSVRYDNFGIYKRNITNTDFFVLTDTLDSGESVFVYTEVADVEEIVLVAGKVYSFLSGLLIAIMSAFFYLLVAKFTKPLVEMNDITKDMAALNFGRKCGNYGKDEIGELGTSINTLSTALDATLMDLKDKNGQLEKDIERRHALDKARKSFINNVSHELKTPLAIISGYAEGLCEGISTDPEVIGDYCKIIKDESYKMNSLVVELLELSKIESGTQPFNPDYFDIGTITSSLLNHLSLQISSKQISVSNNLPDNLICYGEGDKIEIVLKNYITNAISHCSGQKKLNISFEDVGKCYRIKVFNTGDHISKDDMPEIWDSFYRADKSHARSENRFGLGLSIVKGIMLTHQCNFGADNIENGVSFNFEVPKGSEYYEK